MTSFGKLEVSGADALPVLERVCAIPFSTDGSKLKVAITDPQDVRGLDELRLATRQSVEFFVAAKNDVLTEIRRLSRAAEAMNASFIGDMAGFDEDEDDLEADDGISDAPLVATHSNAHALCPASRNLTDRQLDAIRDSGGVVGVNFAVGFLREDGHNDASTPITEIVRHIDYLVERMGIDHVAFGSDFDGATIPDELGGAAGLPKLIGALRDAGYDDAAIAKLTHENWLRVLRETWRP
jgi:hypothetical protein